jgi:hypothetical protein
MFEDMVVDQRLAEQNINIVLFVCLRKLLKNVILDSDRVTFSPWTTLTSRKAINNRIQSTIEKERYRIAIFPRRIDNSM